MTAPLLTITLLRLLHKGIDHVNRLVHHEWRKVTSNICGNAHPLEHLQHWRIADHLALEEVPDRRRPERCAKVPRGKTHESQRSAPLQTLVCGLLRNLKDAKDFSTIMLLDNAKGVQNVRQLLRLAVDEGPVEID